MTDAPAIPQPVFCRSFGDGARRALALHCTIAHSGAWRGLSEALGGQATLVAPDMLSHGRSPVWDGQGDFQDRSVAAVEPLLEEGMDVIGHSFGATIALRLAVAHPEKVRSLTLVEPVYFAVVLQDQPEKLATHDDEAAPFLEAIKSGDMTRAARLFNRMWADPDSPRWPDLPEQTRAAMTRAVHVVPACTPSIYDDRPGMLAPGVLDRVSMPVLLLRGSQTHPVMSIVNDGLARRLPDARNVVVDGAGHMLPLSHPADMGDALRRLFADS